MRDTHGTRWLDELVGDLRFALRGVRRAPGFSFTIVLTLTLGIGANTTMFTLLRGTLLKPLPNRHGEQLVYLRQSTATTPNELFSVPRSPTIARRRPPVRHRRILAVDLHAHRR
jgi:hypothetical protein